MRRIKRRDTKPELLLRSALHRRGHRFRVDYRTLQGRPDIVFTKKRLVVMVHGCFWHQHSACIQASKPRSNREYWGPKLEANVSRDARNISALTYLGYQVIVVWECEVESQLAATVDKIERLLRPSEHNIS